MGMTFGDRLGTPYMDPDDDASDDKSYDPTNNPDNDNKPLLDYNADNMGDDYDADNLPIKEVDLAKTTTERTTWMKIKNLILMKI